MLSCCVAAVSGSPLGLSALIRAVNICAVLATQIIFFVASGCLLTMSSIPQGAFAAFKVRSYSQLKEEKNQYTTANKKPVEQTPLKYNSKMMNSIWGQYNRYSVHNMKKNTDGKEVLVWAEQRLATATPPAYSVPGFTPNFFN